MRRLLGLLLIIAAVAWSPLAFAQMAKPNFTLQSTTSTGNGTPLSVAGWPTVGLQVVMTASGTVTFEATIDGTNWTSLSCLLSSDGALYASTTSSGIYQCVVSGYAQIRAPVSANTGTITVTGLVTTASIRGSGSGGVTGWPTNSATKEITWANSLANAMRVGDGVTPICLYTDATLGPQVRPCTDANVSTIIPANFVWSLYDIEGAAAILTVDPDAATPLLQWQIGTAYRWKKSIYFGAGSLSTDGTQCAAPAEVTPVASGPKLWSIICTDNDGSTIHGSVRMPLNWDAGTVTFTHVYQQTAADTGVLNGDIACQARSNGEAPSSTYGSEVAIDDAAVVGTGSNDMTTSAAVTCAGTGIAAGDMLYFRYQLDAAGTTAAVATLHHLAFILHYNEVGPSQ